MYICMYECLLAAQHMDSWRYVHTHYTCIMAQTTKEILCCIALEQAMFISYYARHC